MTYVLSFVVVASANALIVSNTMQYCHKWPKHSDGGTTHPFCSKTCAQQAKAAGVVGGASVVNMCDVRCLLLSSP